MSMVPDDRLQEIILSKDAERALEWCSKHRYVECWAITDGALVIYDGDDVPSWFDFARDDDGNSKGVVTLEREEADALAAYVAGDFIDVDAIDSALAKIHG